jgi:CheY-like chemotaxis protein
MLPAHALPSLPNSALLKSSTNNTTASPRRLRSPLPQCAISNNMKVDPTLGTGAQHVYYRQPSSRAKPVAAAASSDEANPAPNDTLQPPPAPTTNEVSANQDATEAADAAAGSMVPASADAAAAAASDSASSAADVSAASTTPVAPIPQSLSNGSSRSFAASYPLSILAVEDNAINMKLVVRMLGALGYTDVAQCWNGAEAVEHVVRQKRHYQLILMDNIMPLLTGPQACKQILQHYDEWQQQQPGVAPRAPTIIALTASCMENDKEEAFRTGHADFLAKPLSLPLLKQKLHHWARVINRPPQPKHQQRAQNALLAAAVATTAPVPNGALVSVACNGNSAALADQITMP